MGLRRGEERLGVWGSLRCHHDTHHPEVPEKDQGSQESAVTNGLLLGPYSHSGVRPSRKPGLGAHPRDTDVHGVAELGM